MHFSYIITKIAIDFIIFVLYVYYFCYGKLFKSTILFYVTVIFFVKTRNKLDYYKKLSKCHYYNSKYYFNNLLLKMFIISFFHFFLHQILLAQYRCIYLLCNIIYICNFKYFILNHSRWSYIFQSKKLKVAVGQNYF